jgi:hypothetical protein
MRSDRADSQDKTAEASEQASHGREVTPKARRFSSRAFERVNETRRGVI